MNRYLDLTDEVKDALKSGKPVVALESTIISHGMPYPKNVQTAVAVEDVIRKNGAVPATIAIINGRLKVGLTPEQLEYFGKKGTAITKVSRRDIPMIVARKEDGATTVAATMMIAAMAGIQVFATIMGISLRLTLVMAVPFLPKYSSCSGVRPTFRRPLMIAIVAGTAPFLRITSSTATAVWTFLGYGIPWLIIVLSRATTGFPDFNASFTSSVRSRYLFIAFLYFLFHILIIQIKAYGLNALSVNP